MSWIIGQIVPLVWIVMKVVEFVTRRTTPTLECGLDELCGGGLFFRGDAGDHEVLMLLVEVCGRIKIDRSRARAGD